MDNVKGLKVAILVADGFEQSELAEPRKALNEAGAQTYLISPVRGKVRGWKDKNWGDEFPVDRELSQVNPEDFDALLLPGGLANPDTLRMNEQAIAFIRHFVENEKPIAAICHGPWTLIEADGVYERIVTSYPSIKSDLINAGATWVDQEVITDGNLVTSRKPQDIPAFNEAFLQVLAQIHHVG